MNENFYFLPMFSTLQHANCGETTSSQFIFLEFTSHFCSKKSSAFHAFSFVGKRKKISVEFIRASVSCGDQNGPKFFCCNFQVCWALQAMGCRNRDAILYIGKLFLFFFIWEETLSKPMKTRVSRSLCGYYTISRLFSAN